MKIILTKTHNGPFHYHHDNREIRVGLVCREAVDLFVKDDPDIVKLIIRDKHFEGSATVLFWRRKDIWGNDRINYDMQGLVGETISNELGEMIIESFPQVLENQTTLYVSITL
jgi:hypothetical protein